MSTPSHSDDPGDSSAPPPVRGGQNPSSTPVERFRERSAAKRADAELVDEETTLWEGGYSPRTMVGTWILLALATVGLFAASAFWEPLTLLIAAAIAVVLWVIGGMVYLVRRIGVRYELTTQRFLHQSGLLTRRTDRIEVIDIDDVSYTQGPVQRMFGVGTIRITGSDRTHPELAMVGIGDVAHVAGMIDDTRRKERRRRSLHIESV